MFFYYKHNVYKHIQAQIWVKIIYSLKQKGPDKKLFYQMKRLGLNNNFNLKS